MPREDRIRLMTKLAIYEQRQGQADMAINQYFKSDYLAVQMIRTVISSTVAFVILVLLNVLYAMETLEENLYKMDYVSVGTDLLIRYLLFVAFFEIVTLLVARYRYNRAHKRQKKYLSGLRKMEKIRELEKPEDNHEIFNRD